MMRLAPSILSADFSCLGKQVGIVEKAGAHLVHVDVMDGHFVPNISFGATVMKSLSGKTKMPFDVHLMIENPDKYAADFVTDQTEFITVHQEACPHLHRSIQNIKSLGVKAGVAINPGTSLSALDYILDEVDLVLVMSVNPGFGGQKFIRSALSKIAMLNEIRERANLSYEIEVDGGITLENAGTVATAGASIIVAGSSVFGASDIDARVREFTGKLKLIAETPKLSSGEEK